uniref:Interleukin n=1 Tax=Mastacembelus armatus TaxID=205130 RepID=A0A3Q3MFL2_9TELE
MSLTLHNICIICLQATSHSQEISIKKCQLKKKQTLTNINLCKQTLSELSSFYRSFLSISTCAADHSPARLKTCLQNVQPTIEKSDAMLYAPSINDIKDNCKARSLQCYIFELMMVLDEEEVSGKGEDCIFAFNSTLQANPDGCPPCEVHALKNITVFLDRLNTLLEKMTQEST